MRQNYKKKIYNLKMYTISDFTIKEYTGCPDQIGRNLKISLLHNQKTNRKCKDSFRIVRNGAIKYVLK